jgi:hypothetical protein
MPAGNSTHAAFWSHQTTACGGGNNGSAKVPTGMPRTPGIASNSVVTVEPQVGQNLIVTLPPDAPDL